MGKIFFVGWALWEKMTFVLACAIVLTIAAGLVKLWYDTRKIKKLSALALKKGKTPAMVEAQDDVPFGIKALHQGVEVEGVWISRTNTPATSRRGSLDPSGSTSYLTGLGSELQRLQAPHLGSPNLRPSRSSFSDASSFDRAVSAERLPSGAVTPNFMPSPVLTGQRPPSISNSMLRNSTTLDSLEGRHRDANSSIYRDISGDDSSNEEENFSLGPRAKEIQAPDEAHPALRVPRSRPGLLHSMTDLEMLQSHRMSHVAETGQLTPRVRPGYSGEWASVADKRATSVGDYLTTNASRPYLEEAAGNPFKSSLDDSVISSSRSVEAPLLTHEDRAEQFVANTHKGYAEVSQQPDEPPTETSQRPARRQSDVLREVNSGFHVLRPGTFGPSNPDPEADYREKRTSKKLHKKRRESSNSEHRTSLG